MSDTPTAEQRAEWQRLATEYAEAVPLYGEYDGAVTELSGRIAMALPRILAALSTVEAERDRAEAKIAEMEGRIPIFDVTSGERVGWAASAHSSDSARLDWLVANLADCWPLPSEFMRGDDLPREIIDEYMARSAADPHWRDKL